MGRRQRTGCITDAGMTIRRGLKEVKESTTNLRMQTAANPTKRRLSQRLQEPKKKVSMEPTPRNPNHNKSENNERPPQRFAV